MKNKYKLIILVISIFFSNPLISQIFDTTYKDEKIKLKGILPDINSSKSFMNLVRNHTENSIYVGALKRNYYYMMQINKDLQLLDTLFVNSVQDYPFFFGPYNNKINDVFYGIRVGYNFDSGNDSAYMILYDLNDGVKIKRIPDSTVEGLNYSLRFTKENEFALLSLPPLSEADINQNLDRFRISIVDTLGNVVNSKVHYRPLKSYVYSFEEHGDKFLFSKYLNTSLDLANIYYIDKNSLEIIDSIPNRMFPNMKSINDSIVIGLTGSQDLYLFITNTNTKTIDTITYNVGEIYESIWPMTAKFDYLRTDSIYLCYEVSSYDGSGFIEILNFGLGGEINFKYRFDNFMYQAPKQITGVKATDDGGVIFTVYLHNYYDRGVNYSSQSWLVKFMPNGLSELTNIETNEKASIKVYPNPSKDFINVDIEADRFSSSEIELFDIQGRLVKKSKLNAQIGNRIDVSTLNPGTYTYRVVINGKGISGKLIIGE